MRRLLCSLVIVGMGYALAGCVIVMPSNSGSNVDLPTSTTPVLPSPPARNTASTPPQVPSTPPIEAPSAPPPQTIAPIPLISYVGQSQDQATMELTEAGFVVATSEDYSTVVPQGSVIAQDPDGCGSCTGSKGDVISLVISLGPQMVEIPDVRGKSRNDAMATLRNAGFTVSVDSSAALPLGYATGTSPAAGEMAAMGSTITLHIV